MSTETPETPPATAEDEQTIEKLVAKASIALVTTVAEDGALVSRPLAVQQREFDGDLWFFTEDPSAKTDQVRANDQVNVAIEAGHGWLSISGTGSVVKDPAKIDELWSTGAEAWFEQGRDDPKVALLRVEARTAEYWTSNAPMVVTLAKYAKAAVTGGRPDVGESKVVEL
ncbi:General stress protein 26 [Microlunatus sagamiharensis]|uniref:General stress protein 26 n=1 Tax=Microlunatus sagamiharensis TaxID=546874 RepID=A0A1H2NCP8_9ACTN|nr:pyridoxamine 5'-phosphate oxidase family protein [Microlunatus sagamiharensis]SDV03223.1 General stress protein 26 [Microlunatus sagamiharensis]